MKEARQLVHGTCVAFGRRAALLRGGSGSGKSDLALRFLALPAEGELEPKLVADDQVFVEARGDGELVASAPPSLAGKIEVRGLGILTVPYLTEAPLVLVVDLVAPEEMPRMPADPLKKNDDRRHGGAGSAARSVRAFLGTQAEIGASFGSVINASYTALGSGLRPARGRDKDSGLWAGGSNFAG